MDKCTDAARLSLRQCFLDVDGGHEAVAEEAGSYRPLRVHFTIAFDLLRETACFRIRVPLSLPHTDISTTRSQFVYLDIPPEQIISLSYCQLPDLPKDMQEQPRPRTPSPVSTIHRQNRPCTCLTFQLARPAMLVIPPSSCSGGVAFRVHTEEDYHIFKALRVVSRQSGRAVVLYSTELQSVLAEDQLDRLCNVISTRCLKSNPHFDLQRLYYGQGGIVLAPDIPVQYDNRADDALPVIDPAGLCAESPPSYDDAGEPPPLAPLSPKPRPAKRARTSTPSAESSCPAYDAQSLDAIIQNAVSSTEARVTASLAAMESRLREELGGQLEALREELMTCIDDRLADHATVLQVEELVSEQLDWHDADLVTRAELEDFVEERLEAARVDLRDRISAALEE